MSHLQFGFKPPHPQCSQWPSLFTAQRIFWPLTMVSQKEIVDHWQMTIESTTVPEYEDSKGRAIIDLGESQIFDTDPSERNQIVQDWDELSGRLCVRIARSRFSQDRKITCRIVLVDFVWDRIYQSTCRGMLHLQGAQTSCSVVPDVAACWLAKESRLLWRSLGYPKHGALAVHCSLQAATHS